MDSFPWTHPPSVVLQTLRRSLIFKKLSYLSPIHYLYKISKEIPVLNQIANLTSMISDLKSKVNIHALVGPSRMSFLSVGTIWMNISQ